MYDIDAIVSGLPFLVNDFFRHRHREHSMSVFLCGQRPEDRRFDLRTQVQHVLHERMGCTGFLGEDIEAIRARRLDDDHLTIETRHAERSDLIVMFLGSAGTISELTAFALNKDANPKLLVFNDARYRDAESFINLGPLKLLDPERIIYYDAEEQGPTEPLVRQLDVAVGLTWFTGAGQRGVGGLGLGFHEFVVLATVYAAQPVRFGDLRELLQVPERRLRTWLGRLFDAGAVREEEKKHLPTRPLEEYGFPGGCVADISRVRAALMASRLKSEETVADYRLIL